MSNVQSNVQCYVQKGWKKRVTTVTTKMFKKKKNIRDVCDTRVTLQECAS